MEQHSCTALRFHLGSTMAICALDIAAHTDENLVKNSKDKEADCPDAESDGDFRPGRNIFGYRLQRRGDEAGYNQSQSLFNPERNKYRQAGDGKPHIVAANPGDRQNDESGKGKSRGSPHPGNEIIMSIKSREEVLKMMAMFRNLTVKSGKNFHQYKKDAGCESIGDDLSQCLDRFLAGIKISVALQDHAEDNQQRRAGSKGGSQKAGGHNRRQPETPPRKTCINEGGHSVDADGPGDREVDQRFYPARRRDFLTIAGQNYPAGKYIDQEIAGEDDHVPEKDGVRRWMQKNIHDARGLAEVDKNEKHAHDYGGNGQELAQHGDPAESLIVMQVVR